MKKLLLVFAITTLTLSLHAQKEGSDYKNALGIRLGPSDPVIKRGISYRRFLNDTKAVEGILSFGDGVGICGLYQIHKPLGTTEGLKWFYGFGGYIGINNTTNNIGGTGIVGLDYKFTAIPLNITLDWKPELNIVSTVGFEAAALGFSARFTF